MQLALTFGRLSDAFRVTGGKRLPLQIRNPLISCYLSSLFVGAGRFELPASRTRTVRSSQAELRPEQG